MTVRTLIGDCRTILPTLPDNSVHTVVTSPPYYSLRDYGTARWEGGDAGCDHLQRAGQRQDVGRENIDGFHGSSLLSELKAKPYVGECGKCGARRIDAQIGLEPTPEAYLQTMVGVFRHIRRVLRDDGTVFCNMGDGFAAKQLLMMPARLALALQADGWWLRSDIIWHKPNPMPESVTDRPTNAHEHIFLLTKRAKYYFDSDAIREPHQDVNHPVVNGRFVNPRAAGGVSDPGYVPCTQAWNGGGMKQLDREYNPAGRSCRNVWTIATSPFSQAHFATFPPALVERCIRAGTSERGCCAACGKPWVRVTERGETRGRSQNDGAGYDLSMPDGGDIYGRNFMPNRSHTITTTGWAAGCACGADVRPCTVLDPFGGAGTTGLVADRLQCDAVMIELNPQYVGMADARIVDDCPLFSSWPPAEDPADERMAFDAQQRDLFGMAAD